MRATLLLTVLPALLATSGCATFATNIAGDFECRAGKEARTGCAPASRVDADATAELARAPDAEDARQPIGIASADRTRTAERLLKIVFPGHIDEAGTLHEEAVAWTVVANPDWVARLRRKPGEKEAGIARAIARRLDDAQNGPGAADALPTILSDPDGVNFAPDTDPFPLASPLVLPSTAREAVAGATAPAVEGFDMMLPHDRTPRSTLPAKPLVYPTAEALDAANAKKEPK